MELNDVIKKLTDMDTDLALANAAPHKLAQSMIDTLIAKLQYDLGDVAKDCDEINQYISGLENIAFNIQWMYEKADEIRDMHEEENRRMNNQLRDEGRIFNRDDL